MIPKCQRLWDVNGYYLLEAKECASFPFLMRTLSNSSGTKCF